VARHVVLLRGINVGRTNRVRMADLRAALAAAGFEGVRTHLQSGNVVLDAQPDVATVQSRVLDVLQTDLGLRVPVVLRTADEVRRVVAENPLGDVATDGSRHLVVFCSAAPDAGTLPAADPPEQLAARGRDLHLWCPGGVRDSPLMAALGRLPAGPVATVRNWNTVSRIRALLDE
jgi:uncharacterized protein (DUF1697 family)